MTLLVSSRLVSSPLLLIYILLCVSSAHRPPTARSLQNMSGTSFESHGAAHGAGVYLSPEMHVSALYVLVRVAFSLFVHVFTRTVFRVRLAHPTCTCLTSHISHLTSHRYSTGGMKTHGGATDAMDSGWQNSLFGSAPVCVASCEVADPYVSHCLF